MKMKNARQKKSSRFFALALICVLSLVCVQDAHSESPAAPRAKKCSAEFFESGCQDDSGKPVDLRKDRTEADGLLFNYFLLGKKEHSDAIRHLNAKPSNEQSRDALKLAEEVRKTAITHILGGRAENELTSEIRAVVERLRTVKIRIAANSDPVCFERGDIGMPNAGYSPMEHAIQICASMTKTPSQEIAETMAHELAHVVSPCAMSKDLIRFQGDPSALGSCLLGIGDGDKRSEEDREIWGDGPISLADFPDEGYAVSMEPEKNEAFLRCGAAEIIPGSRIEKPEIYRSFNSCAEMRYKTAREDALAFELFHLEKKPDFSKLPQPKGAQWEREFKSRLSKQSPICFRKREEHFADSLGGQWYSSWAKEKDLGPKAYLTGLHGLSHPFCSEKISKNFKMSPHQYPSAAERLEILLKPRAVSDLLGCEPVPEKPAGLCALPEDAFHRGTKASAGGSGSGSRAAPAGPTKSRGTSR